MSSHDPDTADQPSPEQAVHRASRRSFIGLIAGAAAACGGWKWLRSRSDDDGIPWPLRKVLRFNESVSGKIFSPSRTIAERSAAQVTPGGPRQNGDIGLEREVDLHAWRLHIAGTNLNFKLDELNTLPEVSQITPLNCIEGWTTVAKWSGVRLADFVDRFFPEGKNKSYVSLATPDGKYYVGLDAPSAFHSQTLLCYKINDQPLSADHGAPLRLLISTKYGIKNLKRVGMIAFTDVRPPDYWAEQGYDWFAGF